MHNPDNKVQYAPTPEPFELRTSNLTQWWVLRCKMTWLGTDAKKSISRWRTRPSYINARWHCGMVRSHILATAKFLVLYLHHSVFFYFHFVLSHGSSCILLWVRGGWQLVLSGLLLLIVIDQVSWVWNPSQSNLEWIRWSDFNIWQIWRDELSGTFSWTTLQIRMLLAMILV